MKPERDTTIDLVRALSILGVMSIHTLSFHLGNVYAAFFWNSLQCVVGSFVFCSGFVHAHYISKLTSFSEVFAWYKKRISRIVIPFYLYFALHFVLFLFFPRVFNNFGMHASLQFFLGSVLLYGGINTNWLPLLFLELTLLTPLLFWLFKKRLLVGYIIVSLCFMIYAAIHPLPYGMYKIVMWDGWSLVFALGLFASTFSTKKTFEKLFSFVSGVSGIIFVLLLFILTELGRSTNFTENKYPPNLYYIAYALAGTGILYFLSKVFVTKIPSIFYSYISRKSYALFFVHFIILDIVLFFQYLYPTFFLIPLELAVVIGGSLGILFAYDTLLQKVKSYSSTAYTTFLSE